MKLKSIKLQHNKEGESIPSKITVEITLEEALWLAIVSGKQRGSSPHNAIFSCMNGEVFNKYWGDGATEAQKEFPIETPPVLYIPSKQHCPQTCNEPGGYCECKSQLNNGE